VTEFYLISYSLALNTKSHIFIDMHTAKLLVVILTLLVLSGMFVFASAQSNYMKVKISTDKPVYVKGDKIRIYVHAKDVNGEAINGALVQLAFTQGAKSYAMQRIFTDDKGVAAFQIILSKKMSSGEYVIFAIVSKPGFNQGTGVGKFNVF